MNKPGHDALAITSIIVVPLTIYYYDIPFLKQYVLDSFHLIKLESFSQKHEMLISVLFLTFISIIGSRFPDLFDTTFIKPLYANKIKKLQEEEIKNSKTNKTKSNNTFHYLWHRQWTHGLIWIPILSICIYTTNSTILFWWTIGYFSHLLGDILTGSVPLFLYGHYGKWNSRIGIDRIFSKFLTQKIQKFFVKLGDNLLYPSILGYLFCLIYFFYM